MRQGMLECSKRNWNKCRHMHVAGQRDVILQCLWRAVGLFRYALAAVLMQATYHVCNTWRFQSMACQGKQSMRLLTYSKRCLRNACSAKLRH